MKLRYSEKGGCCLYLAITGVVLVVALVLSVYFGWRYAVNQVVDNYAESSPVSFPVIDASSEKGTALTIKFEQFVTAVENNQAVDPFVLSGEDINVLIANWGITQLIEQPLEGNGAPRSDFESATIGKHVHIRVEDKTITGDVSVPLVWFGIEDKYINGSATFSVSFVNGYLNIRITDLIVRGHEIPAQFVEALAHENLAKNSMDDPEVRRFLEKFERIEVRDSKVHLIPKSPII